MKIYCLLLLYRSSIGILCSFSWYTFCHKIYHFKIFLIFNMHFYKKKLKKNPILFSITLKQRAFILLTINLERHSLWWNNNKKIEHDQPPAFLKIKTPNFSISHSDRKIIKSVKSITLAPMHNSNGHADKITLTAFVSALLHLCCDHQWKG